MIPNDQQFSHPDFVQQIIKSTLISIMPFEMHEEKPGLIPSFFNVPACEDEDEPVCLILSEAMHYVRIDEKRSFPVKTPSYALADSIVRDYLNSQMEAQIGCHPGLFWEVGEWTPTMVRKKLADRLAEIKAIQLRWFTQICKLADDDWEKTRQHNAISDTQRIAARRIDPQNVRMRPWILMTPQESTDARMIGLTKCGACGGEIPEDAVICRHCHLVIDMDKYKKMSFATGNLSTGSGIDLSKVMRQ